MDLSNLSSDLPPTKLLELVSVLDLNRELASEFKNAAKSVASLYNASGNTTDAKPAKTEFANAARAVASLYRLGSNSNVLLMHKGYLECLDDLLEVISNDEDIENWVLTKRAELTNRYNNRDKDGVSANSELGTGGSGVLAVEEAPETELSELHLPSEYEFMFPLELSSKLHFRSALSPLSVTYKRSKRQDRPRKKLTQQQENSGSSEYESDVTDANEDIETKKRRALQSLHDVAKRRRRDPASDDD